MKGDPYECIRPINSDGMAESALRHEANELWQVAVPFLNSKRLKPASDDVCKKEYLDLIAEMEVPKLRELVSYLRCNATAKDMICSCWHMSAEESDAMWKIYCQQNGVAIRSTVGRLQDSLRFPEPHNPFYDSDTFEIAKVVYLNNSETAPQHFGERPWLIKRRAFEHEKELRVCLSSRSFPFSRTTPVKFLQPPVVQFSGSRSRLCQISQTTETR